MQLQQTPLNTETDIWEKMIFSSNQEMLQYLNNLGCDTSRIVEKDGILMCPADGKPGATMYKLSNVQENEVRFVQSLPMKELIEGLKKTPEEWGAEILEKIEVLRLELTKLGFHDQLNIEYSQQFPGCEELSDETLKKEIEGLTTLFMDEVCGILRKRSNGDYYLDTDNPLIKERNEEGYKGIISNIPKEKIEDLFITKKFREGTFVVVRVENNKIVEFLNKSAWSM